MDNKSYILIGVGLGLVVAVVVIGRQVAGAAGAAGQAINPLNNNNVFASGVNAAGAAVSNDPAWSLGGWLYDLTHPRVDYSAPIVSDPWAAEQDALAIMPLDVPGGGATSSW